MSWTTGPTREQADKCLKKLADYETHLPGELIAELRRFIEAARKLLPDMSGKRPKRESK